MLAIGFTTFATIASTAVAQQGYLTSDGPVTLAGVATGQPDLSDFTMFGTSNAECPEIVYTGHAASATPHKALSSGSSQVTFTPHFGACTVGGAPMTVDMNGCDFVLEINKRTAASAHAFGIQTSIVCPAGKHIQTTLFSSGTHAFRICTIAIEEDVSGYSGLEMTDRTNGKIDLTGTTSSIKMSRSGLGCSMGTDEDAKVDVDLTFEGLSELGEPTAMALSE